MLSSSFYPYSRYLLSTGNYKILISPFLLHNVRLFFVFQELNVRQLTLSTDKDKYGIRLRAEPDHMVLGKRLKGAFKAVTASIKELTSEKLEVFQKTGMSLRKPLLNCFMFQQRTFTHIIYTTFCHYLLVLVKYIHIYYTVSKCWILIR